MKYTPRQYARAFSELARESKTAAQEATLVQNFTTLLERNGDIGHRDTIMRETDKALRHEYGKRTVLLETARSVIGLEKKIGGFITKDDVVERRVDASLVAGVRITIDDEDQFDGTMKRKLDKLFS